MKRSLWIVGFVFAGLVAASCGPYPPPQPAVPAPVAAISAGERHTCAVVTNGTVRCWGDNYYGQLGNTTNNGVDDRANPSPRRVVGLTDVVQVVTGDRHSCALLGDGTVSCWGNNFYAQLGNTTNLGLHNANPTPTPVAGLSDVTQITTGLHHMCALSGDGSVSCWGLNNFGQLGNDLNPGGSNRNPTPTPVAGLSAATQITSGYHHSCALLDDGTSACWGSNELGQLGNATTSGDSSSNHSPLAVEGLSEVIEVTAGGNHGCAVLDGGSVSCWGNNFYGQLGNSSDVGTNSPHPAATTVAGLSDVTQLAGGYGSSCALLGDETVSCWGINVYGQLGNPTNNGTILSNPTPAPISGLVDVKQITAGYGHSCAVLGDETAKCWGVNYFGQMGNSFDLRTLTAHPTPTAVVGINL